jgi:hypothetical protein
MNTLRRIITFLASLGSARDWCMDFLCLLLIAAAVYLFLIF